MSFITTIQEAIFEDLASHNHCDNNCTHYIVLLDNKKFDSIISETRDLFAIEISKSSDSEILTPADKVNRIDAIWGPISNQVTILRYATNDDLLVISKKIKWISEEPIKE